jgi:hypothetical protein
MGPIVDPQVVRSPFGDDAIAIIQNAAAGRRILLFTHVVVLSVVQMLEPEFSVFLTILTTMAIRTGIAISACCAWPGR